MKILRKGIRVCIFQIPMATTVGYRCDNTYQEFPFHKLMVDPRVILKVFRATQGAYYKSIDYPFLEFYSYSYYHG